MQVSEKQSAKVREIAQTYHLKLVFLFGSQASGRAHRESDVDIAVLPQKNFTFEKEVRLIADLMPVLGDVDLTVLSKARPLLMYGVFEHAQVLYEEDPLLFPRYRAYAFKRYVEAKPLYEYRHERFQRRFAEHSL